MLRGLVCFALVLSALSGLQSCGIKTSNRPPQIDSTPGTTAMVGQPYSYDVGATDPDSADVLGFALTTAPSGMDINPGSGLISWMPSSPGASDVVVEVSDGKGGIDRQSFAVTVAPAQPLPRVSAGPDQAINLPATAALDGTVSIDDLPVGGTLTTEWTKQSGPGNVTFSNVSAVDTTAGFFKAGPYVLRLTARYDGLSASAEVAVNVSAPSTGNVGLPPDPATVAPPIDQTVATTLDVATAFLHTGPNSIQSGVAEGTINPAHIAVIRGRVLDKQNNALPGVAIAVRNRPEFGQTLSRADGRFDMAVNGGGQITLRYIKTGFLPAQRQVNAPWQDYVFTEDVVLIQPDTKVTTVDLTSTSQAIQVAQGSQVTDQHGTRQATLLIPQGTQAQVYNPDGTTRSVTSLRLRLTEYTTGSNGPATMPAPLPPSSAYTYAFEIKADEADIKRNGKDVVFDRPVPFYINNFLNFPVGGAVPVGYYDQDKGVWVPSGNGKIIKILTVGNGTVEIDSDGDGLTDDAAKLATLGISPQERARLADLYTAGQSLWRVQVGHLSTWDCNWPYSMPDDAAAPQNPRPEVDAGEDDAHKKCGSVIECENQVLRESLPITGTGLTLTYTSGRAAGRKARNTAVIPVSGASLPASLKRIDLQIDIAGRHFEQSFPAQPNQRYTFTWDGLDGFGRLVASAAKARVRIGYAYDPVYASPGQLALAFARFSGVALEGNRTRNEVRIWQEQFILLGALDAQSQSVAGWSLSVHHAYDPIGRSLYFGTGDRRSVDAASSLVINTVAGNGQSSMSGFGDGGPATAAIVFQPSSVAFGPDGSLYIADTGDARIRRVGSDGIIATVAGGSQASAHADGGPATAARLSQPQDVALGQDGSLYIADAGSMRIRRVGTDGTITTVAGNGTQGSDGDGGPATAARLSFPSGVALGPDGGLYIADSQNFRIRRVGPDGIITTVAGDGRAGFGGDGGQAAAARLGSPSDIALDSEGNLYISDSNNHVIRRVRPDGVITTVAGKRGLSGPSGDGGLATDAGLWYPSGIAFGADGNLYIADGFYPRIRRVGPEGIITTVAGNGSVGFAGDGGPATAAGLNSPRRIALSPDGSLYIPDEKNNRIRRVVSTLPGFAVSDIAIPSEDGTKLYRFNASGRHLQTLNALTGAVVHQFAYGATNLLASATDGDGNVITIDRDATGKAIAIVAPFGQRTALGLDTRGHLASLNNPAGEAYRMIYTNDGLLTEFRDPKGNTSRMSYDALGRLGRDTDAGGGFTSLARTETSRSHTVDLGTALGRTTRYLVAHQATGIRRRLSTAPDGTQTETLVGIDGSSKTTLADGTVINLVEGPDPRFSMLAPMPKSLTIATGGLTSSLTTARTVSLVDPRNPLSLSTQTDTVTINGRTFASVYDAATKTASGTTAAGRTSKATIDDLGRVVQAQAAGLLATELAYDARGRVSRVSQGTGNDQRTASFAYNPQGHLDKITDPLGRNLSFAYDAAGRVTRQTLPDGREVRYGYDANGNLTSLAPPGRPAHVFRYTARDQTGEYQPPTVANAGNTSYEYNLDKELTRVTRPDQLSLNFAYDSAGRLSALTLPTGQIGYRYDTTTGKLVGITAQDATLSYTYNGALLSRIAWTGSVTGQVDRSYDNDFRVTSLSVNGANPITFQYDADGLLTKAGDLTLSRSAQNGRLIGTALANVADSYAYDGFGAVTAYEAKHGPNSLLRFEYAHDKLGRVTQKKEIRAGVATRTFNYGYDTAGRLIEVKRDGVVTASYGYDTNGNRAQLNGATVAHYDDQDRLIDYQVATYQYTANGETRTKSMGGSTTAFQYDVLGNLKSAALPNGRQIEYLIDGNGRRIGKKIDGILVQAFLYQGKLRPAAELNSSGAVVSRFIYATSVNAPDYMIKNGVIYRIVKDHLGSPRMVVNVVMNTIIQEIDYDAFGNVIIDTYPGFQPFGFAGGLHDLDIGLVHFGAREYDPQTGRWTRKDPVTFGGGDTNLYGYVLNDPVNLIDTQGLFAGAAIPAGTAIAAGSATIVGAGAIAFGAGYLLGTIVNHFIEDWIQDRLTIFLDEPTTNTQLSPELYEKHANLEYNRYKDRCSRSPPSGLDPCEAAKWRAARARDCALMRSAWDRQYFPGRHNSAIHQAYLEEANALKEVARNCPPAQWVCE